MLNITFSCITAKSLEITKAQANADEVRRKAQEIYQAADAENHACDFAIMRRKKGKRRSLPCCV